MISVNTNEGAMVALQTLNRTNSQMAKSQNAIATGLKIASAKDNGALFAIANKMRSDVGAYDRVRESADRAASILDTGIAAGESIMELLNEMKGKALAGTQAGNSASAQSALAADFAQRRDQITSIVANASFDGANMIAGTPSNAVSLGDAAGGNTITINGASLALASTTIPVLTTFFGEVGVNNGPDPVVQSVLQFADKGTVNVSGPLLTPTSPKKAPSYRLCKSSNSWAFKLCRLLTLLRKQRSRCSAKTKHNLADQLGPDSKDLGLFCVNWLDATHQN